MEYPAPPHRPSFSDKPLSYEYWFKLNRTIDYIQMHYAEDLNLTRLAKIACFSKFHFHRLFRSFMGETAIDFVRRVRLEKAVAMLILDKHKSITDIAFDCGFSSSQNFAKAFKSYFGVPSTFIREKFDWNAIKDRFENKETLNESELQSQWANRADNFRSQWRLLLKDIMEHRTTLPVRVSEMPSYYVAYIRGIGPYQPEMIASSFGRLLHWAAPRGILNEKSILLGALWNHPQITPEGKCIFDVCITMPESLKINEDINAQSLPGGKYAVYHCEIGADEFLESWMRLTYDWLVSSDYQPDDRPGYIIVYNYNEPLPSQSWKVDLCLAIKPS